MKKIYFFYPSYIIGGAELLLLRTAELLLDSYDVCIIDIDNGWLLQQAKNSDKIKYTLLEKQNNKYSLEDEATLITTANLLFYLDYFFEKSNAKILLWAVQPYNIIPSLPRQKLTPSHLFDLKSHINRIYYILTKNSRCQLIKLLFKKNAIVAMDNACNIILQHFLQLQYPSYLPVFLNIPKKKLAPPLLLNDSIINATWLGRLDHNFKSHILKKLIYDLNIYAQNHTDKKINFFIIGEGDAFEDIYTFSKKCFNITILFLGTLTNVDLEKALQKTDIGFAMGTSSLEMAIRGIPTVLLDFSYIPINKHYHYRWLFEAENYDLGRDISYLSEEPIENIDIIIDQLINTYEELQNKCYNHVANHHSGEHVHKKVCQALSATNLTMEEVYSYKKYKPFWIKLKQLIGKK